jgi:hypothetical protein
MHSTINKIKNFTQVTSKAFLIETAISFVFNLKGLKDSMTASALPCPCFDSWSGTNNVTHQVFVPSVQMLIQEKGKENSSITFKIILTLRIL